MKKISSELKLGWFLGAQYFKNIFFKFHNENICLETRKQKNVFKKYAILLWKEILGSFYEKTFQSNFSNCIVHCASFWPWQ